MNPLKYENQYDQIHGFLQRLLRLRELHLQLQSGLHLRHHLCLRHGRLSLHRTGRARWFREVLNN